MEGENQPPRPITLKDIALKVAKESVAISIEGQEPSWMNALSRKFVGSIPVEKKSQVERVRHPEQTGGTYQIGSFDELLERDEVPSEAIDALYGKDRPNISYLELDGAALLALGADQVVSILSRNNIVNYSSMVAFTMKAGKHEVLLTAMKMALEIKKEIQFPLVVVKKGASVIPKAHELTHAIKAEIYSDAKSLHDYINNPEEREAFLNSILIYRLKNPTRSFFDFAREQESVTEEEFPDEKIKGMIENGKGKYLGLQKQMWSLIDKQVGQGSKLEIDNLSKTKSITQGEIEKTRPSTRDTVPRTMDFEGSRKKQPEKQEQRTYNPVIAKRRQLETDIYHLMSQGAKEDIIGKAKELYESYSDDPVYAAYRVGEIYEELGDAENAKRYYKEAIGYGKKEYFYHDVATKKLKSIK